MSVVPDTSPEHRVTQHLRPWAHAIIATDTSLAADGALRIGHALSEREGTTLTLVSVVEPMTYPLPVNDLAIPPSAIPSPEDEVLAARRQAVLQQCERACVPPAPGIVVELSVPLSGILFQAATRKADLLVLGLGRHRAVDRLFGTETALHAVREADVTTLAVPGTMSALPRHAVVGMDFDASSLAAARAAARMVGPHGRITLVHVDPLAEPLPAMLADWPPHVLDRLNDAFARMRRQLALPETLTVDVMPLAGNIGKELVAYTAQVGADLIVVGRHSRSLMERVVLGSVATRVIRTASTAVMVVPREL